MAVVQCSELIVQCSKLIIKCSQLIKKCLELIFNICRYNQTIAEMVLKFSHFIVDVWYTWGTAYTSRGTHTMLFTYRRKFVIDRKMRTIDITMFGINRTMFEIDRTMFEIDRGMLDVCKSY